MAKAKHYSELPVEKWNVRHFHDFIQDTHQKRFGLAYQPGNGWRAEQGLLGTVIGTQTKPGQYNKALIKEFIERCFAEYRPSARYPGLNFHRMWTYNKNVLQQLEIEFNRRNTERKAQEQDLTEMEDWL